ncbi:MAG: helix-turn-helix domain-containing protein [Oscillospiraceae bacterium]|nr:helix-turn-helix domain-containing protein [Oscillospiraceae bacterium]
MKLLLSVKEAAEALGISRSKLYELIHAEAFPTMSIGGRRLIPVSGLERWIDSQTGPPDGEQYDDLAQAIPASTTIATVWPGKVYELRKGGNDA